jgi:phenylpropionate dioxygenase-like ring-hydroxylating dioxygenase large terminal subunit
MSGPSGIAEQRGTTLPIPNGWFAVGWSRDLVDGAVKRIRYFGEELVLFRARSGRAHVLDAYCPHLGAHLGEGGRVVGDTIRCPFHGWRFDGAGTCVAIPYCERIPPAARLRAWPVSEANGMIFVWHHAEAKDPDWEVPVLPELGHPDWTEPRTLELNVAVHMQEMAENNCDPVHFQFVHGMIEQPASDVTYSDGGRSFRIVSRQQRQTQLGTFETELVRDSWSLGVTTVRVEGIPGAGLLMFSSTSPIDAAHTCSRWSFAVTKNLADLAGEDFIQGLQTGVQQDVRIWENKIHRARPVLCEADTYLAEFRRWTRQFYSDPT